MNVIAHAGTAHPVPMPAPPPDRGDATYELHDGDVTPTHSLEFSDGRIVLVWVDKTTNEIRVIVDGKAR